MRDCQELLLTVWEFVDLRGEVAVARSRFVARVKLVPVCIETEANRIRQIPNKWIKSATPPHSRREENTVL
jgi:hypothetical protein